MRNECINVNTDGYMRVMRPCLSEGINALAQFPKILSMPSRHALCLVSFRNPRVSSDNWQVRLDQEMENIQL
jgi:hypothetical protein